MHGNKIKSSLANSSRASGVAKQLISSPRTAHPCGTFCFVENSSGISYKAKNKFPIRNPQEIFRVGNFHLPVMFLPIPIYSCSYSDSYTFSFKIRLHHPLRLRLSMPLLRYASQERHTSHVPACGQYRVTRMLPPESQFLPHWLLP